MASIAPQAGSEPNTNNSDNAQRPVLPPSDVEEVVKAEIKELRSTAPFDSVRY
jgi:hypothetical protein